MMFSAVILDILTLCSLAGAYAVDYYTSRKIGMLRWINYYTNRFLKACPAETVKYLVSAVLLLATVLLLIVYLKRRGQLPPFLRAATFPVWITLAVHFIALFSLTLKTNRAMYFILFLTAFAVLLQLIKNLLILFGRTK